MTTPRFLLIGVSLAVIATSAAADPSCGSCARRGEARGDGRGNQWNSMLGRLDANDDGRISESEFEGQHQRFDKLDRNGDGIVTRTEMGGRMSDRRARGGDFFFQADANGDGQVSQSEWTDQRTRAFDRLDSDRDGYLDRHEFMSARSSRGRDRS